MELKESNTRLQNVLDLVRQDTTVLTAVDTIKNISQLGMLYTEIIECPSQTNNFCDEGSSIVKAVCNQK